jgi:hypothetical protein
MAGFCHTSARANTANIMKNTIPLKTAASLLALARCCCWQGALAYPFSG